MNKKRCHTLLPLVQLLPTVAAAAAVLFALPRTVPVLAAVPEKLTTVVEQPVEAVSSEAEEETLPKLPYADGVYVGSSRGYGGAVRVQVTMENGSMSGTWVGIFETAEGGARLTCIETVNAKHWWMRPLVPGYLKRQQKRYLDDLRRELQK